MYHCYANGTFYSYSASQECTSGTHSAVGGRVDAGGGTSSANGVCVAHRTPSGSNIASDCTSNFSGAAAISYSRQNALVRNVAKSNVLGVIYGLGTYYN